MFPGPRCTWWLLAVGLLGACSLDRAPKAPSDAARVGVDDGAAGGGTGGQGNGGDGDGTVTDNASNFFGGPCSDDEPLTACATGAGSTGNDPSCFDSDASTACPDRPRDVGDQTGGDGDTSTGGGQCTRMCDDGFYCNGLERCDRASPAADAAGCVTTVACGSGEVCLEGSRSCAPCADGDDPDGDGHADVRCGGDDCREGDPLVHPGATEACNLIDDDCDGVIDGDNARGGCSQDPLVFLMRHVISPACIAGACQVELCLPGWFDCNTNFADGCEHEINPVPGDCLVTDCLGAMAVDDSDTDNGDECMKVTCSNGQRSVAPDEGAPCGNSGTCDQEGGCQEN